MSEITKNQEAIFSYLYALDVNEHVEKKKSGSAVLSYLSWAWAWAEVKKKYPDANYEIERFENNLPYVYDENTGYMVFTKVTIGGMTHEMWLPVMDGANKAMKAKPYTYKVIKWTNGKRDGFTDKSVDGATMFDVNKTIMRCLVKNLAMFGLGLYIYAGEDLPETPQASKEQIDELKSMFDTLATLLKRSPKTVEAQVLARFNYAGKLADLNEAQFEVIKEHMADGIEKTKVAAENAKGD